MAWEKWGDVQRDRSREPTTKEKADTNPAAPFVPAVLTLTRTPIPNHYPLPNRGFHFVNQWGLER
jgi:hypothetical protein